MKTKAIFNFTRRRGLLLLSIFLTCLLAVGVNGWQTKRAQDSKKKAMRERIATIIRETLERGESNVNGVRVITRTSPSESAVEEIRQYGDDAVPILVDYFSSENTLERNLALRLLGLLGGPRIIKPLREIILYDPSPSFRQLALRWITQAPWEQASPIIRQAAETDPDKRVREEAKDILANYAPK